MGKQKLGILRASKGRAFAFLSSVGMATASFGGLYACETKSAIAPDASFEDSGQDLPSDAQADAGLYPIAVECEEPCRVRYRELEPFDMPIDHHTTFILERPDGAYLYVVGGITVEPSGQTVSAVNRRISSAKIREDGSLEPFQHLDFPNDVGLAFHAQIVLNANNPTMNQVPVWGGGFVWTADAEPNEQVPNTQAFAAPFRPTSQSGSGLDQFEENVGQTLALKLPGFGLLHSSLARTAEGTSQVFHFVGGTKISEGQAPTAEVWSASLAIDGDVPARATDLPETRSHHGVVMHENTTYVLGGFGLDAGSSVARDAVLRARVGQGGEIVGWDRVGTLEDPPWTFGTFQNQGYIYVVGGGHEMADMHDHGGSDATVGDATIPDASPDGGMVDSGHIHQTGHVYVGGEPGFDGNPFIARVRRARILEDGTLSPFEDVNPLPARRSHVHQTPLHKNFFYSVGGRIMRGTNRVQTIDRIFVGEIL